MLNNIIWQCREFQGFTERVSSKDLRIRWKLGRIHNAVDWWQFFDNWLFEKRRYYFQSIISGIKYYFLLYIFIASQTYIFFNFTPNKVGKIFVLSTPLQITVKRKYYFFLILFDSFVHEHIIQLNDSYPSLDKWFLQFKINFKCNDFF